MRDGVEAFDRNEKVKDGLKLIGALDGGAFGAWAAWKESVFMGETNLSLNGEERG